MRFRSLRVLSALFALSSSLAVSARAQEAAPVLTGRWVSTSPENMGHTFAIRSFTFEGERWRVQFRAFADSLAKQPLFTIDVGGVFVIGARSTKVPGAWEGIFPAQYRRLTADSEAGVAMFAAQGCQLKLGQTLSLTHKSCGFVPSLMQAMGEYDLVSLKGDLLYFGDRSGDLTKERPAALTPFPTRKQSQTQ